MSETEKLTELLESLDRNHSGDTVSIGDIVENFASRGFAPLLVVPAMLAMICPLPGVPTACGLFVALVAIQQVFGRRSPWLPRRLREVSIGQQRFHRAIEKARPFTTRLDRLLKPRLSFIDQPAVERIIAILVVLLGLSMAPLELVPFAAALPSATLLLIALGMVARDGLVMIIALGIAFIGLAWIALII
ncbi:exopolysaccharide biosynthesis protein [Kushneria phosphatilytica]|uniref:exopolysaccharide biosynthesis protein n=1 Tax=Kushneria phosphatilytica TaxID=657387 RepID=UPI0008DAC214|nr:exopolysaccharide biosynthesis protein [Kushneria phosphatilytica]OHV12911.1 exopolysaccharide biosynthesis protein exod [Kushneria phosphatilytica]